MADVTISQLGLGTPNTGIVVPYSDGTTTYQAKLSSLITATGDMGSGAFRIPVGTTAQRPQTTATGMIRYNTTTSSLEFYNGSVWINIVGTYTAEVLVVAGGGGGGLCYGGGGGAGGLIYNPNFVLTSGTVTPITVGAGGAGRAVNGGSGVNGNNSIFGSFTAIGGGGGGGGCGTVGLNGGSGGGGSSSPSPFAGGTGTAGQGNNGAISPYGEGGGGGGAGFATSVRKGGDGIQYSITGISKYYAGGGTGGMWPAGNNLAGGLGGGGTGGYFTTPNTADATPNTGGGGGGGIQSGTSYSGQGGSGIVIVRYQGTQRASGGNNIYQITESGITYTIHEFTSIGSSTLTA